MSANTTFSVQMNCSGCSGACTRILTKIPGKSSRVFRFGFEWKGRTNLNTGVSDVKATLEDQKIRVAYDPEKANPQEMLVALKKWGDSGNKRVELIG